jgi:hypothetical protein
MQCEECKTKNAGVLPSYSSCQTCLKARLAYLDNFLCPCGGTADTLRLERSGLGRAGATPVSGTNFQ